MITLLAALFITAAQAQTAPLSATACGLMLKDRAQEHNLAPLDREAFLKSGIKFPAQIQLEMERDHEFLKGRSGQVRFIAPFRDDAFYDALLARLGLRITMDEINRRWREPHRHFHTRDTHLNEVLNRIETEPGLDEEERDELRVAALFYDIVYEPGAKDNEERSAELLSEISPAGTEHEHLISNAVQIVLETQDHFGNSRLSEHFQRFDTAILSRPYADLLEWEHSIFKEYQSEDWLTYREKRIEFLRPHARYNPAVTALIEHLRRWQPRIAVFAGSFDPLHIGHYALIIEAERHFDKVIVARGVNPTKPGPKQYSWDLALTLPHHQTAEYKGFLTTYLRGLGYPVTLLRGIRNGHDMEAERTQIALMRAQMPELRTMPIMADAAYDHISSSAFRMLREIEDREGLPHGTSWDYLTLHDRLRLESAAAPPAIARP